MYVYVIVNIISVAIKKISFLNKKKKVLETSRHSNVFSMQKDIYFHSQAPLEESLIICRQSIKRRRNGRPFTCEYSRIAWYFPPRGGSISVKVSSHRRHCKQLCDGMEIPCRVKFTCSRKATFNWLKALLTKG